jgi:hypothetical protein
MAEQAADDGQRHAGVHEHARNFWATGGVIFIFLEADVSPKNFLY